MEEIREMINQMQEILAKAGKIVEKECAIEGVYVDLDQEVHLLNKAKTQSAIYQMGEASEIEPIGKSGFVIVYNNNLKFTIFGESFVANDYLILKLKDGCLAGLEEDEVESAINQVRARLTVVAVGREDIVAYPLD